MTTTGKIVAVNGNMITVAFDGAVAQNEVGYAVLGDKRLMAEIVRVRGNFGLLHADGYVKDKLVASADFKFALKEPEQM